MTKAMNIIGATTMIAGLLVGPSIPCWYSQTGEILDQNTIITKDGNLWEYETNFEAGTRVKVYFNDMETPDKQDDYIWLVTKK